MSSHAVDLKGNQKVVNWGALSWLLKGKKELTLFSCILPFFLNQNYMNLNYLENVISGRDLADHPAPCLSFDKRGS